MAKIAIIGTGWGARVQVPTFREAGFEIAGIAGRDPEKTRGIADGLGIRAFGSWREAVESDADLVAITSPVRTHAEYARATLDAGKHVLCEKPMAIDAAEAEALVQLASRAPDRIALIDHELRFVPSFVAARERAPGLGGLRYVEVRYSSPARGDRSREWTWWSDAAEGGGILGAVGSHFVDTIRYVTRSEVTEVQAMVETIIRERSGKTVTSDDFSSLNMRLSNGGLVAMALSAVSSGPDDASSITFHFEDGALRLVGEELLFAERGKPFTRIAGGEMADRPGNSKGGAFGTGTHLIALALRAAIDDGHRQALAPASTFADGLAHQKVLDAARRSARENGWMTVQA